MKNLFLIRASCRVITGLCCESGRVKLGMHYDIFSKDNITNPARSLIASFSGKFYRLRGYKQQRDLLKTAETEIDKKEQE